MFGKGCEWGIAGRPRFVEGVVLLLIFGKVCRGVGEVRFVKGVFVCVFGKRCVGVGGARFVDGVVLLLIFGKGCDGVVGTAW